MTREEKKSAKYAAILNAAVEVFHNRRYDEVTLDEISARAGIGKGTLYLYFKNKEDLFVQMAVDGVEEMTDRVKAMTESKEAYEKIFYSLGEELFGFFQQRAGLVRLMHQTGSKQILREFEKHRRHMKKAVRALLDRGVTEGVLRNDFTVDELQVVLVGSLLLYGRFFADGGKVLSGSILQIIWDGIVKR